MKILGFHIKLVTYSTFDRIAEFYNSLAAVIIGNLFFIGYRFFEVDTLFKKYLRGVKMDEVSVDVASKLIAVVIIFTMLLISVNRDRFKWPRSAEVLGFLITLFINLYFWNVWQYKSIEDTIFKIGISLITSSFDVAFAHLFIKKWESRQRRTKAEQSTSAIERDLSDKKRTLSEIRAKIGQEEQKLKGLHVKVKDIEEDIKRRTCPKCQKEFGSVNALNGHIKNCKVKKP